MTDSENITDKQVCLAHVFRLTDVCTSKVQCTLQLALLEKIWNVMQPLSDPPLVFSTIKLPCLVRQIMAIYSSI